MSLYQDVFQVSHTMLMPTVVELFRRMGIRLAVVTREGSVAAPTPTLLLSLALLVVLLWLANAAPLLTLSINRATCATAFFRRLVGVMTKKDVIKHMHVMTRRRAHVRYH